MRLTPGGDSFLSAPLYSRPPAQQQPHAERMRDTMARNDIRLVAQLNVHEGRRDALKAALEETASIAINNPAMLNYEFYASGDGATAWALERYADSDAGTGHLNDPRVRLDSHAGGQTTKKTDHRGRKRPDAISKWAMVNGNGRRQADYEAAVVRAIGPSGT